MVSVQNNDQRLETPNVFQETTRQRLGRYAHTMLPAVAATALTAQIIYNLLPQEEQLPLSQVQAQMEAMRYNMTVLSTAAVQQAVQSTQTCRETFAFTQTLVAAALPTAQALFAAAGVLFSRRIPACHVPQGQQGVHCVTTERRRGQVRTECTRIPDSYEYQCKDRRVVEEVPIAQMTCSFSQVGNGDCALPNRLGVLNDDGYTKTECCYQP